MTDASPETIKRLIDNSEKGLKDIEMSLPLILETRQVVIDAIKKQEGSNVILDLMLAVFDTLLVESEVIYDLSTSLDALLKATDDYTKRFYMQSLNLCFVEACQVFAGEKGDENGLLTRLEKLAKQIHQAGSLFIAQHIIDDIREFRKDYCDKDLRNITRHYDDPIKMYEKLQELDSIEFFAKGASQLMAIRMEVSVVSAYLLNLFTPVKKTAPSTATPAKKDVRDIINDAVYQSFSEKDFQVVLRRMLDAGQRSVDECYAKYKTCQKAVDFLAERNCQIPEDLKNMESLILLRMETLYLQHDIACSIWGYLNASTDKVRSQDLRLIHIVKQAALTHIYGYNEKTREKSLWNRIMRAEEAGSMRLDTRSVKMSLDELTSNLDGDNVNSRMFAHYRFKNEFYIPARLEAFGKMQHHNELTDAFKLFDVTRVLDRYTKDFLCLISDNQKQIRKRNYDEWMEKIDALTVQMENDERAKEALKPLRNIIEEFYGEKKITNNTI